jgi:DNA-binding beta-propeller fold protein YncE
MGFSRFSFNQSRLVRIDPNLFGFPTVVGNLTPSGADYSAGAFDLAGNLYVLNTGIAGNSTLSTLDKNTGAVLSTIRTNVDLGTTAGLAFDPDTGVGYVADNLTNRLYTINTPTGVMTEVGQLGVNNLAGLAFVPVVTAVPEPGSLALLGAGAFTALGYFGLRRGKTAKPK